MLGDIGPEREGCIKRRRIEDHPKDDGDEEWEGGYRAPVEVVEGLEGAREAVEERSATVQGVRESVDCGEEEVKGNSPVCQDREVGKGIVDVADAVSVVIACLPADHKKEDDEGIKRLSGKYTISSCSLPRCST